MVQRKRGVRSGAGGVLAALAVALAASVFHAGTAVAAGTQVHGPHVIDERNIGPDVTGEPFPANDAFDPIVATHPTDPRRIAVVYHRYRYGLKTPVRISHDGGATWYEHYSQPGAGSGRAASWHASIAWGRGPRSGSARLYWVDATSTQPKFDDFRLSLAWSDNEGATWSRLWLAMATPSTSKGMYPDVTVDRDPHSPNYGVVYVAYNWFASDAAEPSLRVLASHDFGETWSAVDVPSVTAPWGYPFADRIGYRVRTGPDGSLYISFYQADYGGRGIGRMGFGIAHVRFDRVRRSFHVDRPVLAIRVSVNAVTARAAPAPGTSDWSRLLPRWTHGLDVNQTSGRVYLAIPDYRSSPPSGQPRGIIRVGKSDDHGRSWRWRTVPAPPRIAGRPQSAHKPTLVVSGGAVFVGFHTMTDVPYGTDPAAGLVSVGNVYAVSHDGGVTFTTPAAISPARWDPDALAHDYNGAGLRDRAERLADGGVIFVYGDGRAAEREPSAHYGETRIYAALIDVRRAPDH